MSKNLYIAAMEPRSGKSIFSLGIMELLSRRIRNVGFFRPIIPDGGRDNNIELIRRRYNLNIPYKDMYAFAHDKAQDMIAEGKYDELLKGILNQYKSLEKNCQFVLCEGTDFTGVGSVFEFDVNADIANNLGSPVLAVVNGRDKTPGDLYDAIRYAKDGFTAQGCTLLAVLANRVNTGDIETLMTKYGRYRLGREPVYFLPEKPSLGKPTFGEIVQALNGTYLLKDPVGLNQPIRHFAIAAMKLPNFLDHIQDGSLIITPGDRADIILGSLAVRKSSTYPAIAGLVLTGGLRPEPQIMRLVEGFKPFPLPIVCVETDTYTTAMNANAVRAALTPENDRKIATALGVFEKYVDLPELEDRINVVRSVRRTPIMFEYELIERAKSDRRHIVLPEGTEPRILRATEILLRRGVCDITLLGDPEEIRQIGDTMGLNLKHAQVVNPLNSRWHAAFSRTYHALRKHRGISEQMASDAMTDVSYFGTMMVYAEKADGMVSGSINTTAHTIRPAFEIIRTRPDCKIVSSVFLMSMADRVLVYGDCAVNPNPTAEQLADIAASSAATARMFGIEPRIAMLSYSTGKSGKGDDVERVRQATVIVKNRHPELKIDGPIQYDAAVDASVARTKLPDSEVAGQATVFIFPDLNTGNNTYKAVQRSAGAVAIGPVLQGLNKPVNDLSRGCRVEDIVNTVAITAIQAQK